jgi:hypothetical protein
MVRYIIYLGKSEGSIGVEFRFDMGIINRVTTDLFKNEINDRQENFYRHGDNARSGGNIRVDC